MISKKQSDYLKAWKSANPEKVKASRERAKKKMRGHYPLQTEYYRKWRASKPDLYMYDKKAREKRYLLHKQDVLATNMRTRKHYPLKNRARALALKHVLIPENLKCQACNNFLATDRHHDDYSKPLEVVFLCKRCHGARHKRLEVSNV